MDLDLPAVGERSAKLRLYGLEGRKYQLQESGALIQWLPRGSYMGNLTHVPLAADVESTAEASYFRVVEE